MMRPLWYEFEEDAPTFAQEDVFLLGGALLVAPVVSPAQTSVTVRLPGGAEQRWYNAQTLALVGVGGSTLALPAPAEHIPVLYRGGAVVPRRERLRRAASQMRYDPFTILVAPDNDGGAAGEVYLDDGETHAYEDGHFAWRSLSYAKGALACAEHAGRPRGRAGAPTGGEALVERVVLLGVPKAPARVTVALAGGAAPRELGFTHDPVGQVLVVRKPGVPIGADWLLSVATL